MSIKVDGSVNGKDSRCREKSLVRAECDAVQTNGVWNERIIIRQAGSELETIAYERVTAAGKGDRIESRARRKIVVVILVQKRKDGKDQVLPGNRCATIPIARICPGRVLEERISFAGPDVGGKQQPALKRFGAWAKGGRAPLARATPAL